MIGINLDSTIIILNDLLAHDDQAILNLINQRVPCNKKLACHNTVQIRSIDDEYSVGLFCFQFYLFTYLFFFGLVYMKLRLMFLL